MAYSVVQYTGDGVTTTFAVPFPFISRDHVIVKVNGIPQSVSWINDGLLQVYPAPANGTSVIIARDSSRLTPIVNFQDAQVLTEADLDTANLQSLYVAQEAFDAADMAAVPAQVAADAAAAATSATDAANSAASASASAVFAANSAGAAATSATNAAASAALVANVWKLDQPNAVTAAQRANIDPNVTFDLNGSTMSAAFRVAPSAALNVPAGMTVTTFRTAGTYKLNFNSAIVPTSIDISTDPASDVNGSAYGYKAKITPQANGSVYGYFSEIVIPSGNTKASIYAYPVYLRVDTTGTLASVNGSLMTLECVGSGVAGFAGNGIEVKGTGTSPRINYPFLVRDTINVGGAAFWYNGQAGNASDFLTYNQTGDLDFRFRVDSLGSIRMGGVGGQRFVADFSNATLANRMLFQDRATNANTSIGAVPTGTGTRAAWQAFGGSDPNNASVIELGANFIANTVGINSAQSGTGTLRDIVFTFAGSEKVRFKANGNVQIGAASDSSKKLQIAGQMNVFDPAQPTAYFGADFSAYTFIGYDVANAVGVIGCDGAKPLAFKFDGYEAVRIKPSGFVGFGTANPAYRLHVAHNIDDTPFIVAGHGSFPDTFFCGLGSQISNGGGNTTGYLKLLVRRATTDATLSVAAVIDPGLNLTMNGLIVPGTDNAFSLGSGTQRWSTVYAATGTINTSDARLKTDVTDSVLGLDFINSLRPVSYKWIVGGNEVTGNEDGTSDVTPRPGKRTHWGLLAQDVKATVDAAGVDFGGFVQDDPNDPASPMGLRYDQFIGPLIKAVQQLTARLVRLEGAGV